MQLTTAMAPKETVDGDSSGVVAEQEQPAAVSSMSRKKNQGGAEEESEEGPGVLECDYLVVGAGTTGMSFVDTLLTENQNCTVILVDKNSKPGGHWTKAYPFVRLHQPSCSYGVNSLLLGKTKDRRGREKQDGEDRRTATEICEYYEKVAEQFHHSGRVKIFFNTSYEGKKNDQYHILKSSTTTAGDNNDDLHVIKVNRKVVESLIYLQVPSMRDGPSFPVDSTINVKPVNDVVNEVGSQKHSNYVVIGAGKTGCDAITYLIDNGVDPTTIQWIVPRDYWYFIRGNIWNYKGRQTWKGRLLLIDPTLENNNAQDIFLALEKNGLIGRLQPNGPIPQVFKGPVLDQRELDLIRSIQDNTIRMGRITEITKDTIKLRDGDIPVPSDDTLFVDCMAEDFYGYENIPSNHKVFDSPDHINMGVLVTFFNPSFSAAIIAFIEANFIDDHEKFDKNQLCYYGTGGYNKTNLQSYYVSFIGQLKTLEALGKYGPAQQFIIESRTNPDAPMHHGGLLKMLWAVFGPLQLKAKGDAFVQKLDNGKFDDLPNGFNDDPILGRPIIDKIPKSAIVNKKELKAPKKGMATYPPKTVK